MKGFYIMKLLFLFLVLNGFSFISPQNFTSSNLPIVVINTGGASIPNDRKITADMGIIYKGEGVRNNLTDPFNDYSGKIGIELRGSSSQMFPKKQYSFETRTVAGEDSNVTLLGMPAEDDWILFAPYNDKTLLRDVLMYKLANDLGRYATRSKFCEVVLNDEYMGVYVLLEKIKRDKNRVDIARLEAVDSTGDDLTGGYIIKIDKTDGENNDGWISPYLPYPGAWQKILYQYHYPKPDDITTVQKNYIKALIYAFESAMNSSFYSDSLSGYPRYIDVDSFVDYFIINEFAKNVDAFRLSMFMYKDKDSKNNKLFAGPAWDFNLGLGNCNYYNAGTPQGWQLEYMISDQPSVREDYFMIPFWWGKLFHDSAFQKKVNDRWQQLKGTVFNQTAIYNYIDSCSANLAEARARNFQKWPVIGTWIWPNNYVGQTYEQELAYLKNFIRDRLTFMSGKLISSAEEYESVPEDYSLFQNYPNPFNPATMISYELPKEELVVISIYNSLGEKIDVLNNSIQPAGKHKLNFSAHNYPSGIYFYKLEAGYYSAVRKMIVLK
jgi:hypothetical protein